MWVRIKEEWPRFRQSRDPASLRVVMGLAIIFVALSVYLLAGPNPWESSITKRLASGKALKLEQLIPYGLWWGALVAWGAAGFALATVRWWSRPHTAVFPDLQPPGPRAGKWTMIFAIAAMALACWPRVARMNHSLWTDEEYHLRTYVWGSVKTDLTGSTKFDAITWPEAVFGNEKGNNHLWSSIEARVGHQLTGHGWGPESTFSESSLRLFPFTTGILTVGMMVLLGTALGGPRIGLAAGLILALHPWHVRWSVEIRGYSTMLFAIVAGLHCLVRALQTNRWRWWTGYSACQCLFLLCFAGSLYVAAAQNLVTLGIILCSAAPAAVRWAGASRLVTAGILSLILTALLFGPHVPQITAYLNAAHEYAPISPAWFVDLWTHLVVGLQPVSDPPGTSLGMGMDQLAAAAPWKKSIVYLVFPALTALGLFTLLRQDWRTRLVGGTLLAAGLLAVIHNSLSGAPFLTWYLLYLIPLFILCLIFGGLALVRLRPKQLASLPLILTVVFAIVTAPAMERMMNIPRQPIREAVGAMIGMPYQPGKSHPEILTASFGDGARQLQSYDRDLRILKTTAELAALILKATAESKPLYLCLRGPHLVAAEAPELHRALTTDARWQQLPPVQGMEAMLSYEIYRFAPASIGRIKLNP